MEHLSRLEGVTSAKGGKDRFHFEVTVSEAKTLLPARLRELVKKRFDDEYPFRSLEVMGLRGAVDASGATFTAGGSGQKFRIRGDGGQRWPGKAAVVAGPVTQEGDSLPEIEFVNAKEITP